MLLLRKYAKILLVYNSRADREQGERDGRPSRLFFAYKKRGGKTL